MDLTFKADGDVFNVRSAAIILHQGHLLCAQEDGLDWVYIPGGRVKRGEDSASALAREMREELSINVDVESPAIVTQSFYDGIDGRYHELTFYYAIEKPAPLSFMPGEICHTHDEDGKLVYHRWILATSEGLAAASVEPKALHAHFIDPPNQAIHVTISE